MQCIVIIAPALRHLLSSFSASLLLWQIWHESTLCDVTLRVETDLLGVDADNPWLCWIYWGKSYKEWMAAAAEDIKKSVQSPFNLPEIDCSPSLAVELHQICLKPLYEVTRDCNASDHLTSLMHWGAGEWARMQASWCFILARCPRCSSRLLPSLLTDCFWRESRRITFAILWREKRQTREHRSPNRSWWEGGRRGRLDLK